MLTAFLSELGGEGAAAVPAVSSKKRGGGAAAAAGAGGGRGKGKAPAALPEKRATAAVASRAADPLLSVFAARPAVPLQPPVAAAAPSVAAADGTAAETGGGARRAKKDAKRKREGDDDGDVEALRDGTGAAAVPAREGEVPNKKPRQKSGKKAPPQSAREREDVDRLARTVFMGNVSVTLRRRHVQRMVNRFLRGEKGSLDALAAVKAPSGARAGAGAGADDDDDDDGAAVEVDDDTTAVVDQDVKNPVECVRLRSIPITGTKVAPGSSYKDMIKVRRRRL